MLREAAGALRERDFRYLFLGRTASLLGNAFAPVALAFAVLDDLDGSATDLGLILAAAWVPQIVFTLIGGVVADRVPRNVLMLGTDLMMFAAQGMVALLLLTDRAEVWHVAALQALGYSLGEARAASRAALAESGVGASLEDRVKAALRSLLRE